MANAPVGLHDFDAHDVVVHVIAVPYGEVAFPHAGHPHFPVEPQCGVVAVHVQLHGCRFAVCLFLDVLLGLEEQGFPVSLFLYFRQDVDFLQMVQSLGLRPYGHVSAGFPGTGVGYIIGMPFGFHLFEQVGDGIHPFHHVVDLPFGQDGLVGVRENPVCQLRNERAVPGGRLSYFHKHVLKFVVWNDIVTFTPYVCFSVQP